MRASTPSFIAEFPLRTSAADERALEVRLEAARHVYNACLDETLKRLAQMRQSKDWQAARTMSKGKERTALFKATMLRFGFSSASIQKHAEACRDACWIGAHLGSHDTQTTSLRAYKAVQMHAFGKRGRPRFKGKNRLHSVEGKGDAVIRLRWQDGKPVVLWDGLALPLLRDPRDRDGWQEQALSCRTKYVRILRRSVRGRTLWCAQLVQEGLAPRKERLPVGAGVVGLDLGPSTIAAVSDTDATLEPFCPGVADLDRQIRRIQRAMDRSRRATNPDAFNPDGSCRRGARIAVRSRRYRVRAAAKAELERCLAAERKRAQGELANRVLAQGNTIKTEKVSYRSFQKNFGRSVKRRAPSLFVSTLKRKAASAGALVVEFATRTTRLSQFNHDTGEYVKKPLSQRWHVFADGERVQRDLYSAWLARFVERDRLDASQCRAHWAAAEPLLRRAASGFNQSASGAGFALPHVRKGVGADRPLQGDGRRDEAADAVAQARAAESSGTGTPRTPWL
ncbi:MAG TPA: transposase [Azospirillum sp.]|nr:transposase [Azospirillum sp.]